MLLREMLCSSNVKDIFSKGAGISCAFFLAIFSCVFLVFFSVEKTIRPCLSCRCLRVPRIIKDLFRSIVCPSLCRTR
jgi:hypothetical protein